MLATPHAAVGAAIGRWVRPPWLAVVVAFFSHFVVDAIPHLDIASFSRTRELLPRVYLIQFAIDIPCFIALMWWLLKVGGPRRTLIFICAFAALGLDVIALTWQLLPSSPFTDFLRLIDRPHHRIHSTVWPDQWVLGTLTQVVTIAISLWIVSRGRAGRGSPSSRSLPAVSP